LRTSTRPTLNLLPLLRATVRTLTLKVSHVPNSIRVLVFNDPPGGCRYASYAARFEGRIVQKMIQHDGGTGDFIEDTPPMLGIWNTLLEGKADATWVFMQWEVRPGAIQVFHLVK